MNTRVLEREMKESVTKFSSIFCFMLVILVNPPSGMANGDPEAGKAKSAAKKAPAKAKAAAGKAKSVAAKAATKAKDLASKPKT